LVLVRGIVLPPLFSPVYHVLPQIANICLPKFCARRPADGVWTHEILRN
jgi:hypothetical protein